MWEETGQAYGYREVRTIGSSRNAKGINEKNYMKTALTVESLLSIEKCGVGDELEFPLAPKQ